MPFRVFKREPDDDELKEIVLDSGAEPDRGRNYRASEALENAVNVAIALGRPILVSGEPGCGKTELGFAIARKIRIPRLHFFSVKSDSEARALFYEYDTIGRFHAAQIGQPGAPADAKRDAADARHFIQYQALGRAILDAHELKDIMHLLAGQYRHPGGPQRSVVVIDEIDKAPRDFPNDLLNEIEQFWFRVPELGQAGGPAPETPRIRIAPEVRPIVVITSNTERQLPDAFLRRCVYHHIAFPDDDTLKAIVEARMMRISQELATDDVGRSLRLMGKARQAAFEKAPGTAELIDFVQVLGKRAGDMPNEPWKARFHACTHALAKTAHDRDILKQLLDSEPG
jgi:MoxR-like ATPase